MFTTADRGSHLLTCLENGSIRLSNCTGSRTADVLGFGHVTFDWLVVCVCVCVCVCVRAYMCMHALSLSLSVVALAVCIYLFECV